MAAVIKWLDDPYLVVKFQRFFGVVPTPAKKAVNGASNGNAHHDSTSCNGSAAVENHSNVDVKSNKNMNCNESASLQHNGIANGSTCIDKSARQNGDVSADQVRKRSNKEQEQSTANDKSLAWDMVSNQERGMSEKWETEEYTIQNKSLYYLFNFGACLGNEIFYITFFPFWLWNIDSFVGRRVCIFWAIFMYLGQLTKDLLKIPRPPSPPVIRMEKLYALEYGMPSTHAMVGAGFPFSILLLTWQRYVYPVEVGVIVALLWTLLVCGSRLYLGMHSVLDIIGGLLYIAVLFPVWLYFVDAIDDFLLQSPYSPIVTTFVPLILCVTYPSYKKWSPARGDTFIILACVSGASMGSWLFFQLGHFSKAPGSAPYQIIYPDLCNLGLLLLRSLIGVVLLFLTRAVVKYIAHNVFCSIFGLDKNDPNSKRELCMEVASKFSTYTLVTFNAFYIAPQLFRMLSIERESFFTEA